MNYSLTIYTNFSTTSAGDPGHSWFSLSNGDSSPQHYGFYAKEGALTTLSGKDVEGEIRTTDGGRLAR